MTDPATPGIAQILCHGPSTDVAVLRWPSQQPERERLDQLGLPRLLLIEPDAPPPESLSCIEDWTRLPAPDQDLFARIAVLRARANRHPQAPTVDQWGRLSFREHHVYLSPGEHAIAQPLAEAFREPVAIALLLTRLFPGHTGTAAKLRLHVHRLRTRIKHIPLYITPIRNYGYMMSDTSSTEPPS
jgi:hypothetical protein